MLEGWGEGGCVLDRGGLGYRETMGVCKVAKTWVERLEVILEGLEGGYRVEGDDGCLQLAKAASRGLRYTRGLGGGL